jgi:tetraacyldisaccharide 4'-kinase
MPERRSIFLYPVSLIYGLITSARNFLYDTGALKSHEFSIPVICVGNLSVGGTGKTPHTEYIAGLLRKNFKVAVLSRGYKRNTKGFLMADAASSVNDIGDEPMQIHKKFPEIIVAVDRDRVHGVRTILKEKPETSVIILDDGFQHRRITPGFSVLLSDFERLMINDAPLPYGNLRESVSNMRRADIILITKSPEDISAIQRRIIVKEINKAPYQNLYFTSLIYKDPLPVFENPDQQRGISSQSENTSIVLVTGIANPKPLSEYLQNRFSEIIHLSYGDHHRFTEKNIENITGAWNRIKSGSKYVITTEKDAARLREFTNIAEPVRSALFYIPLGINFLNDDKDEFDNLIVDYVRKNKRNNRIS